MCVGCGGRLGTGPAHCGGQREEGGGAHGSRTRGGQPWHRAQAQGGRSPGHGGPAAGARQPAVSGPPPRERTVSRPNAQGRRPVLRRGTGFWLREACPGRLDPRTAAAAGGGPFSKGGGQPLGEKSVLEIQRGRVGTQAPAPTSASHCSLRQSVSNAAQRNARLLSYYCPK